MSFNEFKKWLKEQGVEMKKSRNGYKLYYQDKISMLHDHGRKEMKTPTMKEIKKQLGL